MMTTKAGLRWMVGVCLMAAGVCAFAAEPGFKSKYYALGFSEGAVGFNYFSVDSLGQGKLSQNPVIENTPTSSTTFLPDGLDHPPMNPQRRGKMNQAPFRSDLTSSSGRKPNALWLSGGDEYLTSWSVQCDEQAFTLRSEFHPRERGYRAPHVDPPLVLNFSQKANHATLLGLMPPGEQAVALPAVLHLPDMGSLRITSNVAGARLDYDARRRIATPYVRVSFPPATAEHPVVTYRLEVAAIYPALAGIEGNPLYDGFRRDYLNIFQLNPRQRMLANNSSSDPVTFAVYPYSEVALHAPPLAEGLSCLDLVRTTVDRYLAGAKGYGQTGYGGTDPDKQLIAWSSPNALDSYPSLLIAACNYAQGAGDWAWAKANFEKLTAWGREMMAADHDGNGLIEYPGSGNYGDRPTPKRRPSNWWDTINFGHEDAYANALAYRACVLIAEVARKLERPAEAEFFAAKGAKLRAAYLPAFLDPKTGVLAGWKSADGQIHDYWFLFVSGVAITYGVVDDAAGNAIMDRLLAKMKEVGYTRFDLGLPGNLVPVRMGDYVKHGGAATKFGEPTREDGSDGFQFYENGGATGCYAYFTIKALYKLGRAEDARRILHPMLKGYAAGNFQGFGENGLSKDWRDWQGGCHGYEGLLVENYLALLAVLDDLKAK